MSREGKVQCPKHLQKRTIVKNVLLVYTKTILHSTFYIDIISRKIRGISSFNQRQRQLQI